MPSAQRVTWAKIRAGTVSVVALLILSVLAYLLTGGTLLQSKVTVYLYLPDATGLAAGAPARLDGVDIGRVRSVNLSGSNQARRVVKVEVTVRRDRLSNIPEDSYAQLSPDSLIGDEFVDITSGHSRRPIRPGAELAYKAQTDLLKSLDLAQFADQLRAVDGTLADIEHARNPVGQFILGNKFYDDSRKRIRQLQAGIRDATSATTKVGQFILSEALYRKISDPLVELDQSLARLQSGQGNGGQFLRDPAAYEQLRSQMADLRRQISDARASQFMQSEDAYNGWNRRLDSLIESVDQMSRAPWLATSEAYDNLNGMTKEMRDGVREFRTDPRKFLRLMF